MPRMLIERETLEKLYKNGIPISEDFTICVEYSRKRMKENTFLDINARENVYQNCLGFINGFLLKNLISKTEHEFLHEKLIEYQRYAREL